MKKLYLIITLIPIFFLSCEEDIAIKAELDESYILNCVLSADTNYQVAFLSRAFDVEGFDPSVYAGDPFVKGAEISLREENDTYFFVEGTLDSIPGFDFDFPVTFYYLDNYQPRPRRSLFIRAETPNGTVLTATQRAVEYKFNSIPFSRTSVPPPDTSIHDIRFRAYEGYNPFYYLPKLSILYETASQPGLIQSIELPREFIVTNGVLDPVYPTITSLLDITYRRENLNIIMSQISEGDHLKSNYKIYGAELSMLIMDDNLAAYYSAENYVEDNYSVVVTKPQFTNISGGLGIFGSYSTVTNKIGMNQDYIFSFGYLKGQ